MRPILRTIALAACLATAACREASPPSRADGALASLHTFVQREFGDEPEFLEDPRYAASFADLDGDGRDEAVVYVQTRPFCGTGGCGMNVLARSGTGWRRVASTAIGWPPIRVLESRSHGWRDLSLMAAGGGIIPGYEALLPFDGRTYADNPSMPPARPIRRGVPGRVLIPREPPFRPMFD